MGSVGKEILHYVQDDMIVAQDDMIVAQDDMIVAQGDMALSIVLQEEQLTEIFSAQSGGSPAYFSARGCSSQGLCSTSSSKFTSE